MARITAVVQSCRAKLEEEDVRLAGAGDRSGAEICAVIEITRDHYPSDGVGTDGTALFSQRAPKPPAAEMLAFSVELSHKYILVTESA